MPKFMEFTKSRDASTAAPLALVAGHLLARVLIFGTFGIFGNFGNFTGAFICARR
jgi:hypothetical protein